uniref:Uncharacterized protein n=1 Tax=Hyaloperonospora arabidopsidis (strain Emoy2) TaxID=559515 RepID=M4C512_HYAAE
MKPSVRESDGVVRSTKQLSKPMSLRTDDIPGDNHSAVLTLQDPKTHSFFQYGMLNQSLSLCIELLGSIFSRLDRFRKILLIDACDSLVTQSNCEVHIWGCADADWFCHRNTIMLEKHGVDPCASRTRSKRSKVGGWFGCPGPLF